MRRPKFINKIWSVEFRKRKKALFISGFNAMYLGVGDEGADVGDGLRGGEGCKRIGILQIKWSFPLILIRIRDREF